MRALLAASAVLVFAVYPALARDLSDMEVRAEIVKNSVAAYKATGHPCACPEDRARDGSRCGKRSAYSRPGGAEPLCYPTDVTDGMVLDWRNAHGAKGQHN
jgi:hypothetical protein